MTTCFYLVLTCCIGLLVAFLIDWAGFQLASLLMGVLG